MLLHGSTETEQALKAVGEILEARGHAYAAVVVGGAALNLLGVVDRPTRDVDIMAFGEPPTDPSPELIAPPQHLPEPLAQAVELTASDLGVAGLRDLIFLKLFAAAASGPSSVHYSDLIALTPSEEELSAAAEWVAMQDASPDFHRILKEVVAHVRSHIG